MNTIYFNNEIKDKIIGLIKKAHFEVVLLVGHCCDYAIFYALENFLKRTKDNPGAMLFIGICRTPQNRFEKNSTLLLPPHSHNLEDYASPEIVENFLSELKNKYENKVFVKFFDGHVTMYHNLIIVDREFLGTGSFNFAYNKPTPHLENFFVTSSKFAHNSIHKSLKEAFKIMEIPFFEPPVSNAYVSIKPCLIYDKYVKTISHTKNNVIVYPQSAKIFCSAYNCMKIEIEIENFSKTVINQQREKTYYECIMKFNTPKSSLLKVRFYGRDGRCHTVEKIIEIRPKWPISADEVKVITTNYENMARKAMQMFDQILMKHKNNPYGKQ